MSGWHYIKDGQVYGPVSVEMITDLVDKGELGDLDQVQPDGMTGWVSPAAALSTAGRNAVPADSPALQQKASPPLQRGVIKYYCDHCGTFLESAASFAGRQDACPACGKATLVPPESTAGAGVFFRKIPMSVYIGSVTVILAVVVTLGVWLAVRDTWERDHSAEIHQLSKQTILLIHAGNNEKGVANCEAMLALVGDRQLGDSRLVDAVAKAKSVAEPVREQLLEQRRLEEARRREADNLAKLRILEDQIVALAQNGAFAQATLQADKTLDFIQSNRTDNTEFTAAIGRVTEVKRTAQVRLDEQRAHEVEQARVAEQRRIDAENEAKGLIKIDGKWISREQAELAKLRAEIEAMKNKPGKVIITVTWKYNDFVGNKADADAVVVLVPEGLQGKLPDCLAPGFAKIVLEGRRKALENKGAYIEIAGGDGKATFNRVKPGKYTAVIVSNNTREDSVQNKLQMKSLERYFDDPSTILHKVTTMKIELLADETFEKSYDFGLTRW